MDIIVHKRTFIADSLNIRSKEERMYNLNNSAQIAGSSSVCSNTLRVHIHIQIHTKIFNVY